MVDNFNEKADFIWSIADLLRGDYKQSEYQKVILPLTVLRRLDCVTEPTKEEVREKYKTLQEQGVENVGPALKRVSGTEVYNTSEYTFDSLCNDPDQIAENLTYYINSYDDDTKEIFEKFDFDHQIQRLDDADFLYKIVRNFAEIDLHPDYVDEWACTRGEMFDAVATTEKSLSALSPELDVVVLSGYHEFRPVERRFIERLVEELPVIALLPFHQDGRSGVDTVAGDALEVYEALDFERVELEPVNESGRAFGTITESLYRLDPDTVPVPDGLRWRELPTPERETRFVARELRTELANGRDPDDLAVVVPGTEAYSGYVEDTFDTFDIPHVTTPASQLNRTFTGSVVHDLLNLAEPDPRAEDLTSLLANPLVDVVDTDQANAVTAAARRRDTVSVSPLLDDVDGEVASLVEELLATLETLRTGDVEGATETLRRLLDERFDLEGATEAYASGAEQAVEQRAYDLVDEVISLFESLAAVNSDLSPLALFTRAFDGVPIRVPQRAAGGHVEVMGLLDARMRSFEKVFLVGLTSEHFPVPPERPAFFEEMTDAHPRFDTGDERLRGRYLFATLLANVDELTITTPETGDDESAVVRSPVLDELQRVTGIAPEDGVDGRVGSREDLQRRIAATDDRRGAVSRAGDRGDFSPEQTKRTDRGLHCADNRGATIKSCPITGLI